MKRSYLVLIVVFIIALILFVVMREDKSDINSMSDDERVMMIREKTANDAAMIQLSSPAESMQIRSPLMVTGTVDDEWFDGVFVAEIHDKSGQVIATSEVKKTGESVDGHTAFGANLSFNAPDKDTVGKLVLKSTTDDVESSHEFAQSLYFGE